MTEEEKLAAEKAAEESEGEEDFDKELEEVQKKTENQFAAERRLARKPKEEEPVDEEELADKVAKKLLPVLQAQNEKAVLESKLSKFDSNPSLKKLVEYHLEHTINSTAGTLDDRIELAESAARRKSILKQASEITIANQNRKQIQNTSLGSGSGTETRGKDKDFSPQQLADIERKAKRLNIDPKSYIERLRTNMQTSGGR